MAALLSSLHLPRAQELGLQQRIAHLEVLHIDGQLAHAGHLRRHVGEVDLRPAIST
jgi:hypothetical protein